MRKKILNSLLCEISYLINFFKNSNSVTRELVTGYRDIESIEDDHDNLPYELKKAEKTITFFSVFQPASFFEF